MKENIKIGIIGLGQRGDIMLENPIIPMMKNGAGIEITAVCDGKTGKGRLSAPSRAYGL